MVRIIAKDSQKTSYGSGALIAKKTNYGFIITNWHVVRDTNGYVKVRFPDKQEFEAAVIAVDARWDLALLIIAEPKNVEPVVISPTIPQKGEVYWVAGYRGVDGVYRIRGGRCIAFQQPEPNAEVEFIEIAVPSEDGDSGGPVFNAKYELAGVLFGSETTTMASHCGRVIKFLEQAAPQVAQLPASPEAVIKAASLSQQSIIQRGAATVGSSATQRSQYAVAQQNTVVSTVSSSSSYGGNGIRARGNVQSAESQQLTPLVRHGFLSLQYDIAAANTLLAAESRTGTDFHVNVPASSGFSLVNSNTNTTASTTPITASRDNLRDNYTSSYPAGSSTTGTSPNTSPGTTNPIQPGSLVQSADASQPATRVTTSGSNTTSGSGSTAVALTSTATGSTANNTSARTPYSGYPDYSGTSQQSTNTNTTASRPGQPTSGQTTQAYVSNDTFRPSAGNRSMTESVSETLPPSVSRNNNVFPTTATQSGRTPEIGTGLNVSNQANSQVASTRPVYGENANNGITNERTSRQVSGNSASPASGTIDTSFQRKTETTVGGTRSGTSNTSPGSPTSGGRTGSTSPNFSTYGKNSTTSPSSTQNANSQNTDSRNNSRNNPLGADEDYASQYALDISGMQADGVLPKYADEFSAVPTGTDVTGASSKFDAIKIVIAILVIFFILFHTIKTMAVAEKRQT